MKKILFILMAVLLFSSCATIQTTTTKSIGDVTAYNDDGSVLKKWSGVELTSTTTTTNTETNSLISRKETSSYKTFGFNFFDSESGKYIVVSNAVPCIIEYDVEVVTHQIENDEKLKDENDEKLKYELIEQYNTINGQIKTNKKLIRDKTINEKAKTSLELFNNKLADELTEIGIILRVKYNYYIGY